jgi:hypothetical protein
VDPEDVTTVVRSDPERGSAVALAVKALYLTAGQIVVN